MSFYRPLRVRSGCLYRISVLKALIKGKNFEIFQSAIFYVKMPITVYTPIAAHVNFYFPGDVIMANFSGEMEVMILGPFTVNAAILWVI